MKIDDLEYCKSLIIKKRHEILQANNFSNWFSDKNYKNTNKSEDLRDNSYCHSGKKHRRHNDNDIHSKAKIIQYLLQLNHAMILISKENSGTCINHIEENLENHL